VTTTAQGLRAIASHALRESNTCHGEFAKIRAPWSWSPFPLLGKVTPSRPCALAPRRKLRFARGEPEAAPPRGGRPRARGLGARTRIVAAGRGGVRAAKLAAHSPKGCVRFRRGGLGHLHLQLREVLGAGTVRKSMDSQRGSQLFATALCFISTSREKQQRRPDCRHHRQRRQTVCQLLSHTVSH